MKWTCYDDADVGSQRFYNHIMQDKIKQFQGEEEDLTKGDRWKVFIKTLN